MYLSVLLLFGNGRKHPGKSWNFLNIYLWLPCCFVNIRKRWQWNRILLVFVISASYFLIFHTYFISFWIVFVIADDISCGNGYKTAVIFWSKFSWRKIKGFYFCLFAFFNLCNKFFVFFCINVYMLFLFLINNLSFSWSHVYSPDE